MNKGKPLTDIKVSEDEAAYIASLPEEKRPAGRCNYCKKKLTNQQLREEFCMTHEMGEPKHEKDCDDRTGR